MVTGGLRECPMHLDGRCFGRVIRVMWWSATLLNLSKIALSIPKIPLPEVNSKRWACVLPNDTLLKNLSRHSREVAC